MKQIYIPLWILVWLENNGHISILHYPFKLFSAVFMTYKKTSFFLLLFNLFTLVYALIYLYIHPYYKYIWVAYVSCVKGNVRLCSIFVFNDLGDEYRYSGII